MEQTTEWKKVWRLWYIFYFYTMNMQLILSFQMNEGLGMSFSHKNCPSQTLTSCKWRLFWIFLMHKLAGNRTARSLTWNLETLINFHTQAQPSSVTLTSSLRLRFSTPLKHFKRYFYNPLLPQLPTYKLACSTVAPVFPVLCLLWRVFRKSKALTRLLSLQIPLKDWNFLEVQPVLPQEDLPQLSWGGPVLGLGFESLPRFKQ